MRTRRLKVSEAAACYHVMTHTVAGTPYFDNRAKERLRKMIWQGIYKGQAKYIFVEEKYQRPGIAERMLEFYDWILNGGKQPDFVV